MEIPDEDVTENNACHGQGILLVRPRISMPVFRSASVVLGFPYWQVDILTYPRLDRFCRLFSRDLCICGRFYRLFRVRSLFIDRFYRSFSTGWFRTDPTPHLDIFYRSLCTDLLGGSFEDRVYRWYLNSSRCLPIRSLIRMFSTDCFAPISSQGSFLPLLIQRSFSSNPILQNTCAHPFFKDRLYRFFSGGRF